MHTLTINEMEQLDGGRFGFWCGFAAGVTVAGGIFGGPLLAGYLFSKAVGVCLIENAVT